MSDAEGVGQVCGRCGRENEPGASNCVRCGIDLSEPFLTASEPEPPAHFCFRHPKVATNLSCGRCERPICTKCAVIGPNGVRCRECARQRVPIRPGAVAYEVKRSVFQVLCSSPWSLWVLITVVGFAFYVLRSCMSAAGAHRGQPPVERTIEEE